ncbi:MAG: acyl-CoA synthetase FdrA [Kiritimatiellae bacterium]|jgi:FdrA protein|nr:acyl-CoA synthetase FdrA [Kiritimatiellia bacterium]MDY0149415.1 acyl-CoA synthetase FdrA [Kiritimatiellia bacterium]
MKTLGRIKQGFYFDSVTLMRLGRELSGTTGVSEASVVMATEANKSILDMSGLLLPEFKKTSDQDLLIVVKAKDAATAKTALDKAEELMARKKKPAATDGDAPPAPRDIPSAVAALPGANLALISVAGRYAAREARKALDAGLHVMLFSDNVSIEDEITLKKLAHKHDRLVMGPDCGTCIINGVPLAFANVVPKGPIGIVGASGTGTQEVACIIANEGSGISQAIGTGGRDIKDAVGGITFLDAMQALADDPNTEVIVLVAKPPEPKVLKKIYTLIRKTSKPVLALMLGEGGSPATLEQAAHLAVAQVKGTDPVKAMERLERRNAILKKEADQIVARRKKAKGRYLRGLFSGGTFCTEAQIVLDGILRHMTSNAPLKGVKKLKNAWTFEKNALVDLGEDEFTVGRAHPMIDFTLRRQMILDEAAKPDTAVILLDVVLGHGANPTPAVELVPVIKKAARQVFVVAGVTGTIGDPQNRAQVVEALRAAGAYVQLSNVAACTLAGYLAATVARKNR